MPNSSSSPQSPGTEPPFVAESAGDDELMRRVQQGDQAAFSVLVNRYYQALVRVAAGKLEDREQAEDTVQECFLAAYRARHTFNTQFAFRTWMWTILLNLCRRQYGRRRRWESIKRRLVEWGIRVWSPGGGIAERPLHTNQVDDREQLERLLRQISDVQADAIRLRFFGELTYNEIAQAMNCSLNTAKWRVKQGLTRLAALASASEGTQDEL